MKSASVKQQDIEYHRIAAAQYDSEVVRRFHFYHVYSLYPWIRGVVGAVPNAVTLDIGTGTGVVACAMAKHGCAVTAIDHSPEMLARAQERADREEVKIKFDCGDIEMLPYADASFDAVAIQGVLHHLTDASQAVREAIRVLRPCGALYISEPCIEGAVISRFLNGITGGLGRLLRANSNKLKVSEHEQPIQGPRLVQDLEAMGLAVKAEYLVRLGFTRFLPESWRIYLTLLLSRPTRHTHGDLVFVSGKKPSLTPGRRDIGHN